MRQVETSRQMARHGAALFAAAAVVTTVGILLPHEPEVETQGLALVAFATALLAVLLAFGGARLPGWSFHAWPVLGTAFVSFALLFNGERNGGPAGGDEMYYLWVVLWTAYHLGRVATAAQVAIVAIAYTATLVAIDPGPIGVSRWVSTVGLAVGTAVVVRLLSERGDRLVAELRHAAATDPLTGLLNRRAFGERFGRELAVARRSGQPFALLLIDVDGFKAINDRDGHVAGDVVLVELSRALADALREVDTVARIGGDEFAALLPATGTEGARDAASRLGERVAARSLPTISVGCAAYGVDGHTMDELVRAADTALYVAKGPKLGDPQGA